MNNKRNVRFEFELVKATCAKTDPKLVVRKFRKEKGSRVYSFCALYLLRSKHEIIRFHHSFCDEMTIVEFSGLIGNLNKLQKIKG